MQRLHDGPATSGDDIYMMKGVGEVRVGAVERVFVDEAGGVGNASMMRHRRLVTVASTRSKASVMCLSDGWNVLVLPGKRQRE